MFWLCCASDSSGWEWLFGAGPVAWTSLSRGITNTDCCPLLHKYRSQSINPTRMFISSTGTTHFSFFISASCAGNKTLKIVLKTRTQPTKRTQGAQPCQAAPGAAEVFTMSGSRVPVRWAGLCWAWLGSAAGMERARSGNGGNDQTRRTGPALLTPGERVYFTLRSRVALQKHLMLDPARGQRRRETRVFERNY